MEHWTEYLVRTICHILDFFTVVIFPI
jgi:hypothetical protein